MTAKSEKIYNDPEIGVIKLVRGSGIRRISIKVHPLKGVRVNVPWLVPYGVAMAFFASKREWVKAALARQSEVQKNVMALTPEQVEELRKKAKAWLPGRLSCLAATYGFAYKSLAIKNNKSNWGSCSTRGNINLNLRLAAVPEPLRDYVLLHELCHLRHHDHGPGFHALLENLCRDRMSVARYEDWRDEKLRADILVFASKSRAAFPVSHLLEKAIRTYRLV